MDPPGECVPPRVRTRDPVEGGPSAAIDRPMTGATPEREPPVGRHPVQRHAMGTPSVRCPTDRAAPAAQAAARPTTV